MLNARRTLDARWMEHHRKTVKGFMISHIEIYRGAEDPRWDAATDSIVGPEPVLLWKGPARLQANKDWRARDVRSASDPQMIQFIRVQVPMNDPVAGRVPHLRPSDTIRVLDGHVPDNWELDPDLARWRLRVRNTLNSSYPWLRNILCGVDISDMREEP